MTPVAGSLKSDAVWVSFTSKLTARHFNGERITMTEVKEQVGAIEVEGVTHLHGNQYRIRFDKLNLMEAGIDFDSDELKCVNLRYVRDGDGKVHANGISKQQMSQLYEDIRLNHLENPLRIRFVLETNEFIVINGERRFRTISKLR